MVTLRPNIKPLIAIVVGIPFLFFILYSKPSTPSYTIDYTDVGVPNSKLVSSGDVYSPSISGSLSSSDKPIASSSVADPVSISTASVPTTSNDSGQSMNGGDIATKSCICDNSPSQASLSSNSLFSFVPNQPVYDDERIFIFAITPTYTRPTQMADMTRLSQTLRLVPDIFWIVIEDSHTESKPVEDLLRRSNIPYVHLLGPRPPTHMDKRSGRGVSNRLKAFEWLRKSYSGTKQKGVIYFTDDDNAYDVRVFDEMRDTHIVSMFPVGLITNLGLSTPIVSQKTGQIIGFHDPFIGRRKFAVDMAGFAVNLQYFLKNNKATMPYKVGYEEDYFLKSLGVQIYELEPKANNCTEILVWHTKTKPADNPKLNLMKKVTKYNETNLPLLYGSLLDV